MVSQNVFIPQVPASVDEEVLFPTRRVFRSNLESIADHIARPAITGEPASSMTFAIYGRWGAGKSTTLKLLEHLIAERIAKSGTGASFTTSHYDAPLWERLPDVRSTLAFTIMKGISTDDPTFLARLLGLLKIVDPSEEGSTVTLDAEAPLKDAIELQAILQRFSSAPPLLEQWMREIANQHVASHLGSADAEQFPPPPRVHAVFIDDLDRCTHEFTASLLAAITYWSGLDQQNLFFVIAASEEHLLDSLRKQLPLGTRYPEQVLEKYVHFGMEVPNLLTTPVEVADYLIALSDRVAASAAVDPQRIQELKELITESAATYPNCVLAPILRLTSDLTPRSVKHRFNTFLAEFRPSADLDPRDVKKWVLKAFWPEFWWRYLWSLELAQTADTAWNTTINQVTRLKEVGDRLRNLWALGNDELGSVLTFLAREGGIDLRGADPYLILYLGAEPAWEAPTPIRTEPGAHSEVSMLQPTDDATVQEESDKPSPLTRLEDQLLLYYLRADQAEDRNDAEETLRNLLEIRALVADPELGPDAGPTVGNAALIAGRMGQLGLALELHQAALRLVPDHYNVMQNYIEFILDNRIADQYDEAQHLLGILETGGQAHKPDRTSSLAIRLAGLRGSQMSAPELARQVQRLLDGLAQEPSMARLLDVVSVLTDTQQFDAIEHASRTVAEAANTDYDRYLALRVLVDSLPTARYRERKADINRYLLATGLACIEGRQKPEDVMHNLATGLAALGYSNAAALLWEEVYRSNSHDEVTRRSFAGHLDSMNRESIAIAVLLGQQLPKLDLPMDELPARFESDSEAWWEELVVEPHSPCTPLVSMP